MLKESNEAFEAVQALLRNLSDEDYQSLKQNSHAVELDSDDKQISMRIDKCDKPDEVRDGFKHCYICGKVKPIEQGFYKRQSRCKACHHVYYKYNPKSRKYHPTLKDE